MNRKTSNKSNEPFISGSDTDSNYTCITDTSPVGASSNTSKQSLIPRATQNLEQIESDIARALSGMIEVSTTIKNAFKGLSRAKFNQRLIGSLRRFSKNVKKSPSTKQLLSLQQISVLRGIGNRVTLNKIAGKIRVSLECSGLIQELLDEPMKLGKLPDHDGSNESSESSGDEEEEILDVGGYDELVQGVLDFLKSDQILEIFKNAATESFLPDKHVSYHTLGSERDICMFRD